MRYRPLVLIVDDNADNREILEARLRSRDYETTTANDGASALAAVQALLPDLVLLDVMMPGLDGIEVTRRLKSDSDLPFMPIILVTAKSETEDLVKGLDAGADDYLTKPIDAQALMARVRSNLRIKALHDLSQQQKAELAEWNRELEQRVEAQVREIERVGRLRRFLSPEVAELALADEDSLLSSRRAEVTVLFADLRGFTAFADAVVPEELMSALNAYHTFAGPLIELHGGTLERFLGDGLMVLFNAPMACQNPVHRASDLALALRDGFHEALGDWTEATEGRGVRLGLGIGIAHGMVTVGQIGFGKRVDYAAVGSVANLAARLCALAEDGTVLMDSVAACAIKDAKHVSPRGPLSIRGFKERITVFELGE